MTVIDRLKKLGVRVPDLLLPAETVDYTKFSVIACDQFSAQPEYWDEVKSIVGDAPSALNMILPEAYLSDDVGADRINAYMAKYLADGTLTEHKQTCVFVRRETVAGVRRGIVLALDLEQYDFSAGSKSLIRATEQTVVERLPARIEIRKNAPLEMPHVMVLINDKSCALMNELDAMCKKPLYSFDLMMDGGHIEGCALDTAEQFETLAAGLERLSGGMLFAMGDGNHSFAAAKRCWDMLKETLTEEEREKHPARYSLVELVNLYEDALEFEPIHRVLFGVNAEQIQRDIGFDAANPPDLQDLQPMLDAWLAKHPEAEIEYIHGEDECRELGKRANSLSIIFPEFRKDSLFRTVEEKGCFVRKSFSMGTARDKRYYLEAKRI